MVYRKGLIVYNISAKKSLYFTEPEFETKQNSEHNKTESQT